MKETEQGNERPPADPLCLDCRWLNHPATHAMTSTFNPGPARRPRPRRPEDPPWPSCLAYPGGIPARFWECYAGHWKPQKGQAGKYVFEDDPGPSWWAWHRRVFESPQKARRWRNRLFRFIWEARSKGVYDEKRNKDHI